jgi:hypothetical protein
MSRSQRANKLIEEFCAQLCLLRERAQAVAKLRGRRMTKSLAELDQSGEAAVRVLQRMDEIEASFLAIRRLLL